MSEDRFFRPRQPVEPKVGVPEEYQEQIFREYVPHWHGCILGPPPYGTFDPVVIQVDLIFQPTREDAEEVLWHRVREACQLWGRDFDDDEWEIQHLELINGGGECRSGLS